MVIEWVNMLMVTIVTAGITVNLGVQYNPVAVVSENYNKMLQWQNTALNKKFKCYKKI